MPNELPAVARTLLNTLLDQFEQPGRQQVARVRLQEDRHHDYFHAHDFAVRRDTNEALQRLAADGCLRLHWRKWEEGNWLVRVELVAERAETIYRWLGRALRNAQEVALRELLTAQSPAAPWHADFLAWTQAQLAAHRSIAPLKLSAAVADAQWNRDLLLALDRIARLRTPLLERKFSVQLFGDSKRFEALRRAVLKVLRQHDPDSAGYGADKAALLRGHLLDRAPEYVPVAGPLVLQAFGQALDLTPFAPSVALSAMTLRAAAVIACAAEAVVTIENQTSFSEFIAAKPALVLAVFTGGFASPTVIALLRGLRAHKPALPFFHWSDVDVGGLRILAQLRKHVEGIEPLAMDADILASYRQHAQPLSPGERASLLQLRAHPLLADCTLLIEQMLATNQKLEQEAVAVALCWRRLAYGLSGLQLEPVPQAE